MSGSYKAGNTERKRGFQTNDSTWCFGDRLFFFFFTVEWTLAFLSFYPFNGFIVNFFILFKTHQINN